MSKTKLRPCPFCGGDEIEISSEDGATKAFYRAYCEACGSAGSFSKSKAAAIVEENKSLRREAAKGSMSAPDWEIERLNKKIMLEQAARIRLLAELLEVFKANKPAEAVRLARKLIEVEMK